jgi:hypothetical protein
MFGRGLGGAVDFHHGLQTREVVRRTKHSWRNYPLAFKWVVAECLSNARICRGAEPWR